MDNWFDTIVIDGEDVNFLLLAQRQADEHPHLAEEIDTMDSDSDNNTGDEVFAYTDHHAH